MGQSVLLTCRGECNDHTRLDNASLNTSNRHCANTADLVDILERETERLIGRTRRRVNGIDSLQERLAGRLGLGLLLPPLVPGAVLGVVDHVVTVEARDRNEGDGLGVVADLLDEVGGFLDDLIVTVFRPLGSVHLVDGDDQLLDTQGVGKQSVLTGLTILGNTSFEFTSTGSDDKDRTISLGGTSDHVLDEITMARSVWTRLSAAKPM